METIKREKHMHFGCATTNELFAYKKQFIIKELCDLHIGNKIRNVEIYNCLVETRINKRRTCLR
ncbi:MAG: hypothetical protein ACFFC3_14715 [Candidatus Odinarchaeota archaeon]